jgi:hypothetical protein
MTFYSNIIYKNIVITVINNTTRKYVPGLVGSTVIFFVGSYTLSQNTIPSHLKESYSPIQWYILNPENAWSSILYALPRAPMIMKLPLITLSIASFSLWSNSEPYINFIDVTSIYWVIITTSIYTLPYSKHKEKVIWVINSFASLFIGTSIYSGFDKDILIYYNDNLIPFTGAVNIVCCIILYSYYLDNIQFNTSVFFIVCGYICKLQTIYHGDYWGTSVFHIFTAIGIHILVYIDKPQLKNDMRINKSRSLPELNKIIIK